MIRHRQLERHHSRRRRCSSARRRHCPREAQEQRQQPGRDGRVVDRYYDPGTGQFLTVDPALQQTDQPYEYAGDDPVNNSDPSGESYRPPGGFTYVSPSLSWPTGGYVYTPAYDAITNNLLPNEGSYSPYQFVNEVDSVLSTIWTGVYQPGKTAPSTQTSKGPLLSGCSGQDMITSISSLGAFTDCFWFGIGVLDGSNGATTPFAGAYGAWSFPDQSVEFMVYSTATAPFAGAANMAVALYQNVLTFDTLENYFEGDLTAILKSEAKAGFKAYTGQDAGYDNFGASCGTLV